MQQPNSTMAGRTLKLLGPILFGERDHRLDRPEVMGSPLPRPADSSGSHDPQGAENRIVKGHPGNGEGILRPVTFRRQLIELLSGKPRSVPSLARELGMARRDMEDDLRHALRSARAAGYKIDVLPARCKACGFVFDAEKLSKPSRCPACKGTRLLEPMIRTGTGR